MPEAREYPVLIFNPNSTPDVRSLLLPSEIVSRRLPNQSNLEGTLTTFFNMQFIALVTREFSSHPWILSKHQKPEICKESTRGRFIQANPSVWNSFMRTRENTHACVYHHRNVLYWRLMRSEISAPFRFQWKWRRICRRKRVMLAQSELHRR